MKIQNCLACQATDKHAIPPTPVQMSPIPTQPWDEIAIDFFGPIYKSGEYIFVLIDKYSRFPLCETMHSLAAEPVIKRLELLFSIFGIPDIVECDNGPPFNSSAYSDFAKFMGFKPRFITPEWPQSNGMVESFIKNLKKVIQTAIIDNVPWKSRLVEFLRNYRSTPHSTTSIAPAVLFFKNAKTSRLPQFKSNFVHTEVDKYAVERDRRKKQIMKNEFDRRKRVKIADIKVNDIVLVKQKQLNKTMSMKPLKYKVIAVKGNMVTAERLTENKNENRITTRNITFFKKWRGDVEEKEKVIELKPKENMEERKGFIVPLFNKKKKNTNELDKFKIGFEKFTSIWNETKIESSFSNNLIVSELVNHKMMSRRF